jgi:hypothetical protein
MNLGFACTYYLFAASILELFTIEMLALLRLTCRMIFDVHHRGINIALLLIHVINVRFFLDIN